MQILRADLSNPNHQQAIVDMLNMYSQSEFGLGKPLPVEVKANLIPGLQATAAQLIFLAFENEQPIGVAVCFPGFSTFNAKPLINIHDLAVTPDFRGKGVGRALLTAVEEEARRRGCCRVTLEVRSDNEPAKQLYQRIGFENSEPETWFWTKTL